MDQDSRLPDPEQEFERLAKLEERLKSHIVGQDQAGYPPWPTPSIWPGCRHLRKLQPVSFIFVGSTGVGARPELVEATGWPTYSTSSESLIRLDMSEFMEKHSVSRIIGSPPGYVEAMTMRDSLRRRSAANLTRSFSLMN